MAASRQLGTLAADDSIPAKVYRYAERFIHQLDRNGDGRVDRTEWTPRWGFVTSDADVDGRVTLEELVRRIAAYGRHRRIRLMPPVTEGQETFPSLLNPTTDNGPPVAAAPKAEDKGPSEGAGNEAGRQAEVSSSSAGEPERRRDTKFVVSPARRLRENGLPSWFVDRDADGDGQLSMGEYAPKPTSTSLAEFSRFDRDGDGVITADEYLRTVKSSGEREAR